MRKPRILQDGATYHVTARINRQETVLNPDVVKELFLRTVERAKDKYSFGISNFCILGNHFHFLIKPGPGASLSRIMQWIMSVFAMAYNREKGITGHVWGSRFFSRIIKGLRDYLEVFGYIDANPVFAGLVSAAWRWEYGGLAHNRKGWSHILELAPEWVLTVFPCHRRRLLPGPDRRGRSFDRKARRSYPKSSKLGAPAHGEVA